LGNRSVRRQGCRARRGPRRLAGVLRGGGCRQARRRSADCRHLYRDPRPAGATRRRAGPAKDPATVGRPDCAAISQGRRGGAATKPGPGRARASESRHSGARAESRQLDECLGRPARAPAWLDPSRACGRRADPHRPPGFQRGWPRGLAAAAARHHRGRAHACGIERPHRRRHLGILPQILAERPARHGDDGRGQLVRGRSHPGERNPRVALAAVRFWPHRCRDRCGARPQRRSVGRLSPRRPAGLGGCRERLFQPGQTTGARANPCRGRYVAEQGSGLSFRGVQSRRIQPARGARRRPACSGDPRCRNSGKGGRRSRCRRLVSGVGRRLGCADGNSRAGITGSALPPRATCRKAGERPALRCGPVSCPTSRFPTAIRDRRRVRTAGRCRPISAGRHRQGRPD